MDRRIVIQDLATNVAADGTAERVWMPYATVWAQVIEDGAEELIRDGGGSQAESTAVFRIRYLGGPTTSNRISYCSGFYDIRSIKEIGRREGHEIRAVWRGES